MKQKKDGIVLAHSKTNDKDARSFSHDVTYYKPLEEHLPSLKKNFIEEIQRERNEKLTIVGTHFESDPELQKKGKDECTLKQKGVDELFALEQTIINSSFDLKTYKHSLYWGSNCNIFLELFDQYLNLNEDEKLVPTGKERLGWYHTIESNIFQCYRGPYDKVLFAGYCVLIQDKTLRKWFDLNYTIYRFVKAPITFGAAATWQTYGIVIPVTDFPEGTVFEIPKSVFEKTFSKRGN